jgi:hypothetical protein
VHDSYIAPILTCICFVSEHFRPAFYAGRLSAWCVWIQTCKGKCLFQKNWLLILLRSVLEKVIVCPILEKFPSVCWIRNFITIYTTAKNVSVSGAGWIESTTSQPTILWSISIPSFSKSVISTSAIFCSGLLHQNFVCISLLFHMSHMSRPSYLSPFDLSNSIW